MVVPYDPARVEEAGRHFDETVRRIQAHELAVTTVPEATIYKECAVRVVVERVGDVLVVQVRESEAKPVQCGDGFFWRQGAATQKLTRDEIRELFRAEGAIRFDLAPCARFRYPQDFDPKKYMAWLRLSGITGQPRTEDVLVNIEAAERSAGSLLFRNAGVLFFAREVRRFFSQAYVTCLLAKGTDKVEVLDRKDFAGGVVADIEDSLRFVERNSRTAWRIEGLRREDVPEYPTASLREAITNAVMHRDWFVDGANVFVELYSDPDRGLEPWRLAAGDDTRRSRQAERPPQPADRRSPPPDRVHREGRNGHPADSGGGAIGRLSGASIRGGRVPDGDGSTRRQKLGPRWTFRSSIHLPDKSPDKSPDKCRCSCSCS